MHYSQLADFFHVWLRVMLEKHHDFARPSTRSTGEVQDTEAEEFAYKLTSVLRECHRVLADSGLLVLTYHHSRVEGWISVYKAIREAGFCITHTQPVRAEMAVSVPIQQSKSPVHFDLILVCRKTPPTVFTEEHDTVPLLACLGEVKTVAQNLRKGGIKTSLGDIKVMLMGAILSRLIVLNDLSEEVSTIHQLESEIDALAKQILDETASPDIHSTIERLQHVEHLYQPKKVPVYQQLRLLLEALDLEYLV